MFLKGYVKTWSKTYIIQKCLPLENKICMWFFFAADYGGYCDLWFGIKNHKTGNYFDNLGYSSYC